MSDSLLPAPPSTPPRTPPLEVASTNCDCCGLTEECTIQYIQNIRDRYQGKWLCGLCVEAVKYEAMRCQRLISSEEALNRHVSFIQTFQSSSPPPNPTGHLIRAMRRILRRSLDSPQLRSMPCSPTRDREPLNVLTRSESCIPSLSLMDGPSD